MMVKTLLIALVVGLVIFSQMDKNAETDDGDAVAIAEDEHNPPKRIMQSAISEASNYSGDESEQVKETAVTNEASTHASHDMDNQYSENQPGEDFDAADITLTDEEEKSVLPDKQNARGEKLNWPPSFYVPPIPDFKGLSKTLGEQMDKFDDMPFFDEMYQKGITGEDFLSTMRLANTCHFYLDDISAEIKNEHGDYLVNPDDIEPAIRQDAYAAYEACFFIIIQACRAYPADCIGLVSSMVYISSLYIHPDQRISHYAFQAFDFKYGNIRKAGYYLTDQETLGRSYNSIDAIPADVREESLRRAEVLKETIIAKEWDFATFKAQYWGHAHESHTATHDNKFEPVDEAYH